MTCFHALGSNVRDYDISDTHVLNHIKNFELLNGYDPESDHIYLPLSLNLVMYTTDMHETSERKYTFASIEVNYNSP